MFPLDIAGIVAAALGGAAIGLERQWSGHAEGPSARFAGIRTFTMLGGLAGLSGWLWTAGAVAAATVLLAGAVAITLAAYVAASRQDVDGTTEVAALIVLAAGVLAGMGRIRLASAIIAVEVLLLVEKSRLHTLVRRIDDLELRAAVRFAVMALVILPLLPPGPYGPSNAVRPRELWLLVLFFSGLSFVGHFLRRAVGPGHGYLLSGLLGGLVSSTNVTLTFARASRGERSIERPLAFGVVAANTVLYPRVAAAVAALKPALLAALVPYLAAPAIVGALAMLPAIARRGEPQTTTPVAERNPLQLSAALQMAVLFQVVLVIVSLVRATWGEAGVLATAAVLGLTDVDALTVSMTRNVAATVPLETAALAIAVGILANTGVKLGVVLFVGSPAFRLIAGGALLLMAAAIGASIVLMT